MGAPATVEGTGPVDVCADVVEIISGLSVLCAAFVKWMVICDGPSGSVCRRVTVIGMAGLWNFSRGRQRCQNFLKG